MKIDFIRAWTARPDDVQALALAPESAAPQQTISGAKKPDKLVGTSGADLINGGAGGDTMTGGRGDDTYVVDDAKDTVVEAFGGGVDTVRSLLLRYTLPAEVENLVLAGTGAQTGIGNDGDNRLVANDAASTLSGGWGNDTFIAGRGAATLTGGYGQDTFVFNVVPTSAGRITDFKPGRDMLDMRGLFDAIGYEAPDPVATGHLAFKANAAGGTDVWFDRDGAGGAAAASRIVTLDAVRPEQLAAQADWFFA
jgi:Ca2+-binding RTX toxin-like protein